MPWKRMLAYVTGEIEESLLLRIEYLLEENRVLRNQLQKRIRLTDPERQVLAEKAVVLLPADDHPAVEFSGLSRPDWECLSELHQPP